MELAHLLLRLLHWSGALRHPSKPCGCYLLYSAAVVTIIALFVATQVAAVVDRQAGSDLDQATLALCVASTMCVGMCKILNILRSEHLFLKLADEVSRQPAGLSVWELAAWRASRLRVRRLSAVYASLAASMAVTWPAAPLAVGGGALPFVARFPFDVDTPAGYGAAFAFQVLVVAVVGVVVPCTDLFTVSCVEHLNSLLHILVHRVENLNAAAASARPSGTQLPTTDKLHTAGGDPLQRDLADCVSLHQRIISEAECLNQAIGGALLLQVVASAAGICFLLFQVAKKTTFHLVETGKLLGYLTFMLSQLLFYCWFGDDMLSKSESVSLAAYRCRWPDAPARFQRSLLMVSMRAHRPLTLRAGKFFVFSRQAFVQVMNVSYSYFTVLRSLSEA